MFIYLYRHERQVHPSYSPSTDTEIESSPSQDFVYNYHRGKLAYGLILFEFTDAVKEGDGDRLFDIYKIALLLYKVGGHYKVCLCGIALLGQDYSCFTRIQCSSDEVESFFLIIMVVKVKTFH